MENGNMSVYPDPMRGADQSYVNQNPESLDKGLTKREYFALKITCAIISFSHEENVPKESNLKSSADSGIMIADYLLQKLEN